MSISCSIIEFLMISILFLADCVFKRQIHSSLDLLSFLLTFGKRFVLVSIFIKLSQFTPLPCTAWWVGLGVVVTVRIFRTFDFPPDIPLCVLGIEQMLFCLSFSSTPNGTLGFAWMTACLMVSSRSLGYALIPVMLTSWGINTGLKNRSGAFFMALNDLTVRLHLCLVQ